MRTRSYIRLVYYCSLCVSVASTASAQSSGQARNAPPDPFVYRSIFHRVATLKIKADKLQTEDNGKASVMRALIRKNAGLTEDQGKILERIALQLETDISAQDAKAQVIIDSFRARYPFKIQDRNAPPPLPSPELIQMWQVRNNMILRARDQLHAELGDSVFTRFDIFQRTKALATTQPLTLTHITAPQ